MATLAPQGPQIARELDPLKVQEFQGRLRAEQNPLLGLLAGGVAAVIAAVAGAAVAYVVNYQSNWLDIVVPLIVGLAVSYFGKGIDKIYGIMGAGLSLIGVVFGNLLMLAAIIAREQSVFIFAVMSAMLLNPVDAVDLLIRTFSLMDLVVYGFAVYFGYRISFRRITPAEREALYRQRTVIQ